MLGNTSLLRHPGPRVGIPLSSRGAPHKAGPRIKSGVTAVLLATFFATPAHASTGEAVNPWVALAYLVAGVFFILALRGLSSPSTSRTGNRFGMLGMLIAVVTTLVTHDIANIVEIGIAIFVGGIFGITVARRIAMTSMPELVAAFHSLVGLAAVLVGWAAYLNPAAFGLLLADGGIAPVSKVEMGLGIAIGAITFSGSVIAFAKLSGKMSGSPILLPGRHIINLGTLAAIIALTALFAMAAPTETMPLIEVAVRMIVSEPSTSESSLMVITTGTDVTLAEITTEPVVAPGVKSLVGVAEPPRL